MTADQISLRDSTYYRQNAIEFMFDKEVAFIVTIR